MKGTFVILVAEDDASDLALLEHAIAKLEPRVELQVARDGDEVIGYLQGCGEFGDRERHPLPDLFLLDLKMPRMNGSEVLRWLRSQPDYVHIPKIMLSGSSVDGDVAEAYYLGANTFFTKPQGVVKFQELMRYVVGYWTLSQQPELHHPA